MRKRIFLDAYLAENLGDDLFLKIIIEHYQDIDFIIRTHKKEYKKNFLKNYSNVNIKIIPSKIIALKNRFSLFNRIYVSYISKLEFDAFVVIGGSIFLQNIGSKELLDERKRLWKSLKKKNKKVFILGSNFGSFHTRSFLNEYKKLFKIIHDISFRDSASFEFFKDFTNVRLNPDIVFSLKLNLYKIRKRTLGISLVSLSKREELIRYENDYIDKIIEIIEHYTNQNYKVTLFSFCKHEGDEDIINLIFDKCKPECKKNIATHFYTGNLEYSLNEYSSMEKTIGSRFHSTVLSLALNKSHLSLAYSSKTTNMLSDLNLEDSVYLIKEISKLSIESVDEALNRNLNYLENIVTDAKNHFMKLDEFLLRSSI